MYFLSFHVISSLTHCLFGTLLYKFHIFVNFPDALLLLISNFISLFYVSKEHISYDTYPYTYVETYFME